MIYVRGNLDIEIINEYLEKPGFELLIIEAFG